MATYEVKIEEATKELSARERIMYKDTTNAIRLDEATLKGKIIITPVDYIVLDIHNEKAQDDTDYKNYIVIDKDGNKYLTGSDSFFNSFIDIWDEMVDANEPDWKIEVYRVPSKNYKGKDFLTCSII